MSLISVENLTFCYPSSFIPVFENVSLRIDTDWKCGFIGRNGRGKTTFLKLLAGELPYRGKITAAVKFRYFPYAVKDETLTTIEVLSEVCPTAAEWEIMREFNLLQVDLSALYRPFNTLSGGEQTKALLAALFSDDGNFLLIDEPTNHLDSGARQTVASYLNRKKGFLLVSHDRRFMDGCADHILALNKTGFEVQSGNYSSYSLNFERQQEAERRQNEKLSGEIKRLERAAAQTSVWSDEVEKSKTGAYDKGYVGHMAAKMMKRSKSIEARRQKAVDMTKSLLNNVESAPKLKLSPLKYHSDLLVKFTETAIYYGGNRIFPPLSFEIRQGERVALSGANGCGKSSVLKLICGQNTEYSGGIKIAPNLKISYLPQDVSHLSGTLAEIARERGIDESLFKAVLNKTGFDKDLFGTDTADFSAGQKKKVLIAANLCESAHLYVWDEPLNYIDVYSRIQIEEFIRDFAPTMIFVEHDAAFREAVATKVVEM